MKCTNTQRCELAGQTHWLVPRAWGGDGPQTSTLRRCRLSGAQTLGLLHSPRSSQPVLTPQLTWTMPMDEASMVVVSGRWSRSSILTASTCRGSEAVRGQEGPQAVPTARTETCDGTITPARVCVLLATPLLRVAGEAARVSCPSPFHTPLPSLVFLNCYMPICSGHHPSSAASATPYQGQKLDSSMGPCPIAVTSPASASAHIHGCSHSLVSCPYLPSVPQCHGTVS